MTVLSQYIFGMLYLSTSVNPLLPVLFLHLSLPGKRIEHMEFAGALKK